MKSFYRWVADHAGLCKGGLFLGLTVFTIYAASFEYVSFLSVYLIDLVIWFFATRFIATAPARLLMEPQKIMEQQCDPYPMLEEAQKLLDSNITGPQRHVAELSYALALRGMGEYQQAAEVLENINIDKFLNTAPYLKYTYYHNLCDINYLLGRTAEARIWHRKYQQIYRDLPETKAKHELTSSHDLMEAETHHYEGRHREALQKATWIKLESPQMVLTAALLAAKCHIALEEPEKAREKLTYIVEHGNKLYIVEEAKALLETFN